jgi:hypothetical protein
VSQGSRLALELPRLLGDPRREMRMSSFGTYLLGFLILIIGLAIGAYLLNVPPTWILVGVVVLLGLGILSATNRTKRRDPPGV